MVIAVAGPYSAPTAQQRQENLDRLNMAAARLLEMGHVPLIDVNAALPVIEKANLTDPYQGIMDISMAVVSACEGILLLAESPGALRELQFFKSRNLPVFYSLDEFSRK